MNEYELRKQGGHYFDISPSSPLQVYTCKNCLTQASRMAIESRMMEKMPCPKPREKSTNITKVNPASKPAIKRFLKWKGKRYQESLCVECGKKTLVCDFKSLGPVMEIEERCYKCLYRIMDSMEKVASELRAAQAGGEWEEDKLEMPTVRDEIGYKTYLK